jgi:hypothetical protein
MKIGLLFEKSSLAMMRQAVLTKTIVIATTLLLSAVPAQSQVDHSDLQEQISLNRQEIRSGIIEQIVERRVFRRKEPSPDLSEPMKTALRSELMKTVLRINQEVRVQKKITFDLAAELHRSDKVDLRDVDQLIAAMGAPSPARSTVSRSMSTLIGPKPYWVGLHPAGSPGHPPYMVVVPEDINTDPNPFGVESGQLPAARLNSLDKANVAHVSYNGH